MTREEFALIGCRLLAIYVFITHSYHLAGYAAVVVGSYDARYPENSPLEFSFWVQAGVTCLYLLAAVALWKYGKKIATLLLK